MNNTNVNAILEAVGELDNEVLEKAFKKKKKKPIMLMVIAAAAVLSLLVGFSVANRNRVEKNGEPIVDLNIKIHDDYMIPPIGEMIELGAKDFMVYHKNSDFIADNFGFDITNDVAVFEGESDAKPGYEYLIGNVSPSTVIGKYGFKSVINEHFTEDVSLDDFSPEIYTRSDFKEAITTMNLYPMYVGVFENCVYTHFWLIDNESGLPVFVANNHYIGELDEPVVSYHEDCGGEYEIVGLNDGNKALIEMNGFLTGNEHPSAYAEFTYDGDLYVLSSPVDIAGMKRIISNLGFTAE